MQTGERGLSLADPTAMAVALDREIGTSWSRHLVEIECASELTRGMTIVDRLNVAHDENNRPAWPDALDAGIKADICWTFDAAALQGDAETRADMNEDLDLSGDWAGTYAYPFAKAPVPFTAKLTERDGWLSGVMEENSVIAGGPPRQRSASVEGRRVRLRRDMVEDVRRSSGAPTTSTTRASSAPTASRSTGPGRSSAIGRARS